MLEIDTPSRPILYWKRLTDAEDCVFCYNIFQVLLLRVVSMLNLALIFVNSRAFGNINKVSMEVKGGHSATKKQRMMPRLNWRHE